MSNYLIKQIAVLIAKEKGDPFLISRYFLLIMKCTFRFNTSYLTSNSFIDYYYRKRPFVLGVID
ncbi:MAG: hypothetical protein V7L29_16460 [Nostoc sp.]|uniref:hypothetical protein n=1 Tax=Nostoc sp. TaxID=1180 RepID=UPI002FF6FD29